MANLQILKIHRPEKIMKIENANIFIIFNHYIFNFDWRFTRFFQEWSAKSE